MSTVLPSCIEFYNIYRKNKPYFIDKFYREMAKRMFYHAYDGYMQYAFPYDELRPLTCDGHDTWGRWAAN